MTAGLNFDNLHGGGYDVCLSHAYKAPSYFTQLNFAMKWLGEQEKTIFLGQGVEYNSTTLSGTFEGVPSHNRIEMPVAEEMQTGMCIGMSLQGYVPICVFPRWNFMLRAADQIVNHLDRIPIYGNGFRPRVIIRVAAPSTDPFNPGPQHDDDFTVAFRYMLRTVPIKTLETAESIFPAYEQAYLTGGSAIIVEYSRMYRDTRA